MAWLTGWTKRKSKIINGSTTTQANYQMQLTAHKGTGTDTATDIYLGTNVRDDFGDVRFTKSDGSSLLNYWIESYTSGSIATVWIQIDSIPITGTTIYIYYDNAPQTTTSSGTSTFDFFDDFSGDLSKWNSNRGSPSILGGILTLQDAATLISKTSHPYPVALRTYANLITDINGIGMVGNSSLVTDVWSDTNQISAYGYSGGNGYQSSKDGTTYSEISFGSPTFEQGVYNIWEYKWTGSAFGLYKNGVLINNKTTNIPTANLYAGFSSYRSGAKIYVDWVLVRKYTSPEPTFGCSGGEEVSVVSWLTGWNRRKSKIVNGSTSGAQTDYQMQLTVHKTTGTDTSTDIYLGTNVRDDFGDVRFTKQDGSSLLNYWIDPSALISGTSATFWIQIDSIPVSPCVTSIYIYYDNPPQTTTGNGTNTFIAYDKGDGIGIVWINNGGTWSNSGGYRKQTSTSAAVYKNTYVNISEDSYIVHTIMKEPSLSTYAWMGLTTEKDGTADTWMTGMPNYADNSKVEIVEENINRYGTSAIGFTLGADIEYEMSMLRQSSVQKVSLQQVGSPISWQVQTTRPSRTNKIAGLLGGYNHEVWYREFYVRKYSSPEPTLGSSGVEESLAVALITATNMIITTSQTPCLQGICTVTATVTWTNQGTATGSFVPSLTIDGTPIVSPYPSEDLGAGASVVHSFDITNLATGDRTICPSPN